jgi:hypothetical protein
MMFFMSASNHHTRFDRVQMEDFLAKAQEGYHRSRPYHNWFHAIDVTHAVYRFIHLYKCNMYLGSLERFGLLVSATCHDIGHPGLNNTFLINSSHELALRYNDKSPLENMHAARLFEILAEPSCNVFSLMSRSQFQAVRRVCIDAILHTDNLLHFAMIKDMQLMGEVNSEILDAARFAFVEDADNWPTVEAAECYRRPEARTLLIKFMLHLADLYSFTKPFKVCRIWAYQGLEEFFLQGDTERQLGVPVQALHDRETVNRSMTQLGFIDYLFSPLLCAGIQVLPPLYNCIEGTLANVKMWHNLWLTETRPPPTTEEKKAQSDRIINLEMKVRAL